jgi:hypothetical protein
MWPLMLAMKRDDGHASVRPSKNAKLLSYGCITIGNVAA